MNMEERGLFTVHPLLAARNCIGTVNYAYSLSQPCPRLLCSLQLWILVQWVWTENFGTGGKNCEFWYRAVQTVNIGMVGCCHNSRVKFQIWTLLKCTGPDTYWWKLQTTVKWHKLASIVNCKICKITQPKNGSLWRDQHQMETLWHCIVVQPIIQTCWNRWKSRLTLIAWQEVWYRHNLQDIFFELQWAIMKVLTQTNELLSTELLHTRDS